MAKYVLMGKYSNEFSSAMVHTPQDRMDVVEPMLNNFGVKLIEFLYITNNPNDDFIAIVDASEEKSLLGAVQMVFASGTFTRVNAFRAFSSGEMKEIFQKGHDGMSSFISAKKAAGFE